MTSPDSEAIQAAAAADSTVTEAPKTTSSWIVQHEERIRTWATIATPLVVAVFGGIITYINSKSQLTLDEQKNQLQRIQILQVLQQDLRDPAKRSEALLIASGVDPSLASKLALNIPMPRDDADALSITTLIRVLYDGARQNLNGQEHIDPRISRRLRALVGEATELMLEGAESFDERSRARMVHYYSLVFRPELIPIFRQHVQGKKSDGQPGDSTDEARAFLDLFKREDAYSMGEYFDKRLASHKSLPFGRVLSQNDRLKEEIARSFSQNLGLLDVPAVEPPKNVPLAFLNRLTTMTKSVASKALIPAISGLLNRFAQETTDLSETQRAKIDLARQKLEQIEQMEPKKRVDALIDLYIEFDASIHKTKDNWDEIYKSLVVYYCATKHKLGSFDQKAAEDFARERGVDGAHLAVIRDLEKAHDGVVKSAEERRAERILHVREQALAIFDALKIIEEVEKLEDPTPAKATEKS